MNAMNLDLLFFGVYGHNGVAPAYYEGAGSKGVQAANSTQLKDDACTQRMTRSVLRATRCLGWSEHATSTSALYCRWQITATSAMRRVSAFSPARATIGARRPAQSPACARGGGVPGRHLRMQRGGAGQIGCRIEHAGHGGQHQADAAQLSSGMEQLGCSSTPTRAACAIGAGGQVRGHAQAASKPEAIFVSSREERLTGVPRRTRQPVPPYVPPTLASCL